MSRKDEIILICKYLKITPVKVGELWTICYKNIRLAGRNKKELYYEFASYMKFDSDWNLLIPVAKQLIEDSNYNTPKIRSLQKAASSFDIEKLFKSVIIVLRR
jgi:hypothetical protein